MITPTKEHAEKLVHLMRKHGITHGLGKPIPGEMCIEALVCHVFGLPHGDQPECVGGEVNRFKIGLNDKPWSTSFARAKGMERLGVAQLGSNMIDQREFRDLLWFKLGTQIQPLIWRFLAAKGNTKERNTLADKMENSKTLDECKVHAHAYAHAHGYGYGYAYAHGYGYDYDYAYDYAYAYGYGYGYDTWFSKIAAVGVSVLQELKSPGCEWLYLCNVTNEVAG